jgi:hypothetical protein
MRSRIQDAAAQITCSKAPTCITYRFYLSMSSRIGADNDAAGSKSNDLIVFDDHRAEGLIAGRNRQLPHLFCMFSECPRAGNTWLHDR